MFSTGELHLISDEHAKVRLLKKCFGLIPGSSTGMIAPSDLLMILRTIDPTSQKLSEDEIKAAIAMELLVSEDEYDDDLSVFDASRRFDRQSHQPIVDLRGTIVMFDGKPLMSNAVDVLEAAVKWTTEVRAAINAIEVEEGKVREALEGHAKTTIAEFQSECRRAVKITELRERILGGSDQGRRHVHQLIPPASQGADSSRLEQLRAERKSIKDEQEAILARETAIEEPYHAALEQAARCHEQLGVLQQWQGTALKIVQTEFEHSLREFRTEQHRRYTTLDATLDRLDAKLALVGQQFLMKSVNSQGHEGHSNLLSSLDGSADFSWLRVPGDAADPSRYTSRNDMTAALVLSDPKNVVGNENKAPNSIRASCESDLRRVVLHIIKVLGAPQAGPADDAPLITFPVFDAFVQRSDVTLIGTPEAIFLEHADVPLAGVDELTRLEAPWHAAAMSFGSFVRSIEDLAEIAYPHAAGMVSPDFLLEKMMTARIRPRWHFATIEDAAHDSIHKTPPPQTLPGDQQGPAGQSPSGAMKSNDGPVSAPNGPHRMDRLLQKNSKAVLPWLGELGAAFRQHASHYHGAVPVSVRGLRGLSSSRVLHALRCAEEPPSTAHGVPLAMRPGIDVAEALKDKNTLDLLNGIAKESKVQPLTATARRSGSATAEETPGVDSEEWDSEASLDAVASFLSFALPSLARHVIMGHLVQLVTGIVADSFVASPTTSSGMTGPVVDLLDPAALKEMVWGLLPTDSDALAESAPVPFAVFLAVIVSLHSVVEHCPPLESLLKCLCRPSEALGL